MAALVKRRTSDCDLGLLACSIGLLFFALTLSASRPVVAQRVDIQIANRVRAPSLDGGTDWINSAGPIALRQLRGKFVVLDFWTYCCINCLHILPELKRLEEAYPNELVVIGVHAPKFANERDTENIREAVIHYHIDHPVVNDANAVIAKKYNVPGWPSLRIIDPQGYVIGTHYGEATFEMLDRFLRRRVARYRREGTLDETPLRFDLERYASAPTPLRFPGKVLADSASSRLFVTDTGHHRIVVATLEGKLLGVIGSGREGSDNGDYAQASFSSPQGLALHDDKLYVADTENHQLRMVDLAQKRVTTIAGTGEQRRQFVVRSPGRATKIQLASPWALWLRENELYVAMAGSHQIWKMLLDRKRIYPFAGSGTEDIIDGPMLARRPFQKGVSAFAQPSGLASDGTRLFVADSEGSSIRVVPLRPNAPVTTLLGTSRLPSRRLFTFGDRDGPLPQALLQHPLGVAFSGDHLYVADTYNNKIKAVHVNRRTITTISGDGRPGDTDGPARFNEPAGLSIAGDTLFVADTNNHVVRAIELGRQHAVRTIEIKGLKPPSISDEKPPLKLPNTKNRPFGPATVRASDRDELLVQLKLELPAGQSLNPSAPMGYVVEAVTGDQIFQADVVGQRLPISAAANEIEIGLPLARRDGIATLRLALVYYFCNDGAKALCRMGAVSWTGKLTVSDTADSDRLRLEYVAR